MRGILTHNPLAGNVIFEDSEYLSTNAQDAIIESTTFYNFSFKVVELTKHIKIPLDQQMYIHSGMRLEGSIRLDGEIVLG